jgi:Fasciclin domain
MKKTILKLILFSGIFQLGIVACNDSVEVAPDEFTQGLSAIPEVSIFADVMAKVGYGLVNSKDSKTIFIPTNEAFEYLDIKDKRDYDKATMIAFLASHIVDSPLSSANFKSGKLTTSNTGYVRVYDGRAFTQIEEALVEKTDLKVGNLTVHLVDRVFDPAVLLGHDHGTHASGHSHGGTHDNSMPNNCGTPVPDKTSLTQANTFRNQTSKFLATLPTWDASATAPRAIAKGGYDLMGGFNNRLPYIHYFSKTNMEDGKFMDPNAPEGIMYGLTADGFVFPISAVYMTREATAAQLHDLNCMYMFHEHDGLPGVMMHYFHDAYPSKNYGLDHEAEPLLVRQMKVK